MPNPPNAVGPPFSEPAAPALPMGPRCPTAWRKQLLLNDDLPSQV